MNIPDYSKLVLNVDINQQLDKVIPVNPLTGVRDDLVHKYEIALTDSERSNILQFLQTQDVKPPCKQLSDKDLIALCPSRFVSSLSDVKHLASAMRDVVNSLDSADKQAAEQSASASSASSDSSSSSN